MIITASHFWVEIAPFLITEWQDTRSVAAAAGLSLWKTSLGLKKGVDLGIIEEQFQAQRYSSRLKPYYRRKP